MIARWGSLFVISAPSGSGKTTLVRNLLASVDSMKFSVSFTTRPKRPSEREGVDYHFVTESGFRKMLAAGDFLEWAEVYGNLYGTSRSQTETIRATGDDVVLDVDVQGAAQVRRADPEAIMIFVLPPSFSTLEDRLRQRQQDSEKAIAGRLINARSEVHHYQDYDYVLINENVAASSEILRAIVLAERVRPARLGERIRRILDSFEKG